MAAAARLRGLPDVRIWVLLGDQELNEGQVWEAAQAASHFGLGNVCAIVDRNRMGLDGDTEQVMSVEPIADRFRAFGWDAREVDGHDVPALLGAFAGLPPATSRRPQLLIAHTIKGKGVGYMESSRTWHLGYLAPADAAATVAEIGADDG
jgi:transketolase